MRRHIGKAYLAYREQLLADGSLVQEKTRIVFKKDVLFTSPSAAASVVAGGAYNGREAWKDNLGVSLKELEEAAASGDVGQ